MTSSLDVSYFFASTGAIRIRCSRTSIILSESEHRPPVDHDLAPRHVGRAGGGKIKREALDVVGVANPADQGLRFESPAVGRDLQPPARDIGHERAGRN